MPLRPSIVCHVLALSALAALSGCRSARALDRVPERGAPASAYTLDLPEGYEIEDTAYGSNLVALDDDPDADDVFERAVVQVRARHTETGETVLFVYDLLRGGSEPSTVVRFRRVPAPRAGPRPAWQ